MAPEHDRDEIKVMVVGDSISHGREGDWTWRYRIWEWFRQEGIKARFVGPYKGTFPPDKPKPPQPPPLPTEQPPLDILRSDGGYAHGVSSEFLANPDHFSAGGRQAAQAKSLIHEQVLTYKPDLCLIQLGFNDLGWCVSGPEGTLASMKELVDQVRVAKADIKLAIANVPHRSAIPSFSELPVMTDQYNKLLAQAITYWWQSQTSPIALVDFCGNYSCGPTTSLAAYDGLHPNTLGEYQLAQAFSRTLIAPPISLGGSHELAIPSHIPTRATPTPSNLRAVAAPSGIIITWTPVYGAYWYDLRVRLVDAHHPNSENGWATHRLTAPRHDTVHTVRGQQYEYSVRACTGDSEDVISPWSAVVSAVAHPKTAPPPENIVVRSTTAKGLTVSWDAPFTGVSEQEIDRYGVYLFDHDVPGSFPSAVGMRGTEGTVEGLVEGHRYGVAIDTWTRTGTGDGVVMVIGGLMRGADRAVVVGRGVKGVVPKKGLKARVVGRETVELEWDGRGDGENEAAGWRVWVRAVVGGEPRVVAELEPPRDSDAVTLKQLVGDFHQSVWAYEYAVSAYNGNDESELSAWVRAPEADTGSDGDDHVSVAGPAALPNIDSLLSTQRDTETEGHVTLGMGDTLQIDLKVGPMLPNRIV